MYQLEFDVAEASQTRTTVDIVIVVTGGRDYADRKTVERTLDRIKRKHPNCVLWHGAARGADSLAAEWAKKNGVVVVPFRAKWNEFGEAAGPRRNELMARNAFASFVAGQRVGVVAFPGGRGTADMKAKAAAYGLPIWEIQS